MNPSSPWDESPIWRTGLAETLARLRIRYCERRPGWTTIFDAVNVRRVFVGFLLILMANLAHGEGSYQRTRDNKTIVWNNSPEPGDVAVWSGARDKDGYAMGYGTLSWYTWRRSNLTGSNIPQDKFIITGRYSGNMVRGKLDGPVTGSDAAGKKLHAAFVDGKRVSDWSDETIEKTKPTEAAGAGTERIATAETMSAPEKKSAKTNATAPGSAMIGSPEQVRPLEPLESERSRKIPDAHAMPEAPAEGPSEETGGKSSPDEASKPVVSAPVKKSLPASTEKAAEGTKPAPSAAPKIVVTKRPLPSSATTSSSPSASASPVDQSLRSLIAPPASLREPTSTSASPAASSTPAKKLPSPPPGPELTAAEATSLADAEARTWGYDLGEYQLPTSEYNAAGGRWNVVYEAKNLDGKPNAAKQFSVAIDDKTRKAEVTK